MWRATARCQIVVMMISPPPEVVITGIGIASPICIGIEAVTRALAGGQSGVRLLGLFDTPQFPVRVGGEAVGFDAKQYVTPR